MPVTLTASTEGFPELKEFFKQFPGKAALSALSVSLFYAVSPVVRYAKRIVPVGDEQQSPNKKLKNNLIKTRKIYKKNLTVFVSAGIQSGKAPHAHLVERRVKAHKTPISNPTKTAAAIFNKRMLRNNSFGGNRNLLDIVTNAYQARGALNHPGTDPNKFMETAHNVKKAEVEARFVSKLTTQLGKEIDKLAQKLARKVTGSRSKIAKV